MNLPLTLLRVRRAMPQVSAGWLASGDPVEWLKEIARCRRQGCEVAIYPVAASAADPRGVGVLLVPRGAVPHFGPRVLPLGELLPGVHTPLDGALSVGLLANERDFFFPYQVHLFHPGLGLVGFDAKDELSPARLLEIPRMRESRWNLALPVARFSPVFRSIHVSEPPDPGEMLAHAGEQIGDHSGEPLKKDRGALGTVSMLGMGLAGGSLLGAGWLIRGLGRVVGFRGIQGVGNIPLERLREWAEKNWQEIADRRSSEIDRLMKLMEEDPDEGLRYALPLSGIEQSRGVAPPSWRLGQRSIRFSQGHGGGAISGWDLANEERLRLERQYRDAAKREISLGRPDRAAYIYGNLLGDWNSAARVLAESGRHRDAVSIYLHKLNNRPAAAKCLEDAGLLIQAAAIYAECKQFEKAGDLQALLGNDEQARELWRAAVDALGDPIEKARILSKKLGDQATALEILDVCWREGPSPPEVGLSAMFAIYRNQGGLAAALKLLREMFAHPQRSFFLTARLHFGHAEASKWDDPAMMRELENEAYRRIGETLAAGAGDSSGVLEFLPKLDPADLLLARDARRFSIQRNPPKIPPTGPPRGSLKPTQVVEISSGVRWYSIAKTPDGVSIAGYGQQMLALARFGTAGCHSSALNTPHNPGKSEVRHLALTSARGTSLLFHFTDFKCLHFHPLDRARTPDNDAIGALRNVLAVGAYGDEGDFAVLQFTSTSSLSVSIYSEAAVLRRTLPIDIAPPEVTGLDWRMAGRGGHLCLVAEGFVAWRDPGGQFVTMNLGESPKSLHLSPTATKEALISLTSEILLIGAPKADKPLETVNLYSDPPSGKSPVSCYLPDGSVVIAHQGGGIIYPPGNRVTESATLFIPADAGNPIDICPRGTGGFAILTSSGKLVVFDG